MTDTKTDSTSIDPMLELTSEQLARTAALASATTLLIQRRAGLANSTVHPSFAEVIDMAEYIIHGHTIVRSFGKKGSEWYSRIDVEGPVTTHVASATVNVEESIEVAA